MNINELTLDQIKEILSSFEIKSTDNRPSTLIGKYVLVRTYSAGVHTGYLVEQNNKIVTLKNSRRLWTWGSNGGVALSGVAQLGLSEGKKIDTMNPFIILTEAIEIILCSDIAEKSINEYA